MSFPALPKWIREAGVPLQINSVFGQWNFNDFDAMAELVISLGIVFWEVFFLVPTGRGEAMKGVTAAQFEEAFAKYFGQKHAVMVNSGSSANLVAIASLFYKKKNPLQRGDEAIVPAISWATTYHPLQQYGLRLKIVDVERDTINVDFAQFEAAISPRTRAIIVNTELRGNLVALTAEVALSKMFGYSNDVRSLSRVANEHQ